MTKEEAIKQIEAFRTCMIVDDAEPYVVEALNMAVEALEQEPWTVTEFADRCMECGKILGDMIKPCDDVVSRDAALKCLTGDFWEDADTVLSRCYEKIKHLPPVTPAEKVGQWIPVSESLPKEDNEVLITIKSCGKWYVCHSVYRDGLFWQKDFEFNSYRNPIAWMYLPEPYKVESEVNE